MHKLFSVKRLSWKIKKNKEFVYYGKNSMIVFNKILISIILDKKNFDGDEIITKIFSSSMKKQ